MGQELFPIHLVISILFSAFEVGDHLEIAQGPCVPRLVPLGIQLRGIVVALHHFIHQLRRPLWPQLLDPLPLFQVCSREQTTNLLYFLKVTSDRFSRIIEAYLSCESRTYISEIVETVVFVSCIP